MKVLKSILLFLFASLFFHKTEAQSLIPCDLICATTQVSGDVILEWDPSTESCGPFIEYIIYASNSITGPYSILDFIFSESTTTYTHIGADGTSTTWYYFIDVLFDCPGYLTTHSDTLDNLDPTAPVIDYVSVTTGGVDIFWEPSTSSKTSGYTIYRDMGGFVAIGTVDGRFTTTFFDNSASAGTHVETYTIAATDDCDNIGPFNVNPHHTILMTATQLGCSDAMELAWNFYDTWPAGVLEYQVWLDVSSTGNTLIATLPSTINTYTYAGLNDSDIFNFTVVAVRADGSAASVSNAWNFSVNVVEPAKFNVIRNATVPNSGVVEIGWYADNSADLLRYEIQRSEDGAGYTTIFSQNTINPTASPDLYTDNTAVTNQKSYYYKTITTDSCEEQVSSGFVRTILLNGIGNDNFTNQLTWNPFEMTNAVVQDYNLFRSISGTQELIATVSSSLLSYLDDVAPIITITDSACYFVEANYILNSVSPAINEQLISRSNKVCFQQDPKVYVPNAIVPGSANGIFKPVIVFGDDNSFNMQIFNRYGEVIFESFDANEGWDGTFKGDIVPVGTYAYLISFLTTDGEPVKKKGNVTVIR
ncbi:MAG: gliding motility-associated C-terminal domain-containing protein [Chitinophagales bacterium]